MMTRTGAAIALTVPVARSRLPLGWASTAALLGGPWAQVRRGRGCASIRTPGTQEACRTENKRRLAECRVDASACGRWRHRADVDRRRVIGAEIERVDPGGAHHRRQRGRLVREVARRDGEPERMARLDHRGRREDFDLELRGDAGG